MKEDLDITSAEEHFTRYHGAPGTKERVEFELKAKAFLIGEIIEDERRLAKLTQEQLADKIGAKKASFPELRMVIQTFSS